MRYVQAKEFGEAEVWMNERLMRAAPQYFAEFITAFEDGEQRNAPQRGPVRRNAYPISASCPWLMRAPLAQLCSGQDLLELDVHAFSGRMR